MAAHVEDSVEYLTEWPPSEGRAEKRSSTPPKFPPLKRPRYELTPQELEMVKTDSSTCAPAILARWWKTKNRDVLWKQNHGTISQSSNPNTIIFHVAKVPEARIFLQARIDYLLSLVTNTQSHGASHAPTSSSVHTSISSCYQKLGKCEAAIDHAKMALQGNPEDTETQWLLELLKRQQKALEERAELERKISWPILPQKPKLSPVQRVSAHLLSYKEFLSQFALPHCPVVITDCKMTARKWDLNYVKQTIGDKVAPLKKLVVDSVEWARLEPAGQSSVRDFIDSLEESSAQGLRYLFDWSLPLNALELAEQLTIPRFFAGDFLQRTPSGSLYQDSWPSLFIAPAGTRSELHVDAFGSNFWMALFEGRKRWVFFHPQDTPSLYPNYCHSTDAVFEVDVECPDFTSHPLFALTHPMECILEEGEVLFVPSGCPHRVENLTKSLAISSNFVDVSNIAAVRRELAVNSLVDQGARCLLQALDGECLDCDEEQKDLTWTEFKTWPRTINRPFIEHNE